MIGVHQAAVVEEAVLGQQGGEAVGELPHRRPVADRADAHGVVQCLEPAQESPLLRLRVGRRARALVQVAVVTDLVAGVADGPDHRRPALGGVARDEEGGTDPLPVEDAEEPRNAGARPVGLVRHDVQPAGALGVLEEDRALGVDVEREAGGRSLPRPATRSQAASGCASRAGRLATASASCAPQRDEREHLVGEVCGQGGRLARRDRRRG